ncbi:hypothetical protein SYNPS1DRAFT_22032 [Syncephalis pseudoplumigaleata]|uniref:Nuclear transport factor 2 n=1 Tax=Syncephalis pseudoplumigaleata TaxID=1712513 RepID=A0A4P9Z2X2_9FUNG|nr:hypothetical protein SYNPS1DRAFT_22032 [Syncephalis pseudoplumigaleata]|eukprot:RKP26141.1 hypothetical protein SYNPS1DRAFT_22032 [Syncephalis pseudoplumigaleata]
MDINSVAQSFTQFYYNTFDANRAQLTPLYRDHSMLTFEGAPLQGVAPIVEKLTNLPFQKVQHKVTTMDAQPADPQGNGIIVMVTGQLMIDDNEHPQPFSQTFHLIRDGDSYYVFNDIFRLNYA